MISLSVKKLVIPIVIIGAFLSCRSEKTTTNLREIEILQATVDSSKVVFKTLDFEGISTMKLKAEEQLEYLKEHNKDTAMALNKFIDVYYSNFKIMRKYLKGHGRLGAEIEFSKGQLINLHHDVDNGFAHDSTFTNHFDDEKLAVSKIVNTCATLLDWEERSTKRYNGMVQPIDSIITELQKQGYR